MVAVVRIPRVPLPFPQVLAILWLSGLPEQPGRPKAVASGETQASIPLPSLRKVAAAGRGCLLVRPPDQAARRRAEPAQRNFQVETEALEARAAVVEVDLLLPRRMVMSALLQGWAGLGLAMVETATCQVMLQAGAGAGVMTQEMLDALAPPGALS